MSKFKMLHLALATRDELLHEFGAVGDLVWSETEQARLASCKTEALRDRLIAGHLLARRLIRQHCGGQITDWRLNGVPGEAPTVVDHPELHLSISHSGTLFSCALSDAPVGIDIEMLKPQRDVQGLAEFVADEAARAQLSALGEAEQVLHFIQHWTLKEAWLKCQGLALDLALMRQLIATNVSMDSANARCWTDMKIGLVLALVSTQIDRFCPDFPDSLSLRETAYWRLEHKK